MVGFFLSRGVTAWRYPAPKSVACPDRSATLNAGLRLAAKARLLRKLLVRPSWAMRCTSRILTVGPLERNSLVPARNTASFVL
jgi:hypothetical protein